MTMRDAYRLLADTYARHSAENPVQTHYDRPAILGLAGDVHGKRVLELGCAGGVLTEQLALAGADVLAVDREPALVAHAIERLAGRARFIVADLEDPLHEVPTGSVDIVVASLVLHYLEDWDPLLTDLHRTLVPGGVLVFSLHHPITGWHLSERTDYHQTEPVKEEWRWDGQPVTATMFRRPLAAVFGPLRRNGFAVDVVDEPLPHDLPPGTDSRIRVALTCEPVFLFVRAVREPS